MTTRGQTDEADGQGVDTVCHLVDDLADRLRRLPESRLNRVATAGHELAQALADAAAGIEGRGAATAPADRAVPVLSVFALADQVAVTGHDLSAAADGLDPATPIWWQGVRKPLSAALTALEAEASRLRSEL